MDIKERVNEIVQKYGTRNPLEIVKAMDAILVFHTLDGVRGFYHYFQRNHIIYVDERLPENELLFVIAHELGHLFLHKDSNAIFMDTRTNLSKILILKNIWILLLINYLDYSVIIKE